MLAPREIELKLDVDPPRAGPAIRRLAGPGDGTRRLVSTIFDTDDRTLHRRGLVLRVRRDGDRRIQTLKAETPGGPLERAEWESAVAGDEPDLAAIPDAALREEIAAVGPLGPIVRTAFDRTLWRIRHNGSDVEIALDQGAILAGGREAPINEIELELKAGAPTALFGLARTILGVVPARPGLRSKSERGFDLATNRHPGRTEPFRVSRGMSVGDAFRTIARTCLRHYGLNEPGIVAGEAEALHRSRVAIRRLRSCLKLHKPLVADEEGERLGRGLRLLSRDLGAARNLDVYLEVSAAAVEEDPDRARIAAEREAAYDRLRTRLRSKRMRLLLLDLLAYVETGGWRRDPARRALRERRVQAFAAKVLEKRWRRLRKAGRNLATQEPASRHTVRIDGKVLRYAAEFFAGAFPGRKRGRRREAFLAALTELQTQLGNLNDMETGSLLAAGTSAGGAVDPVREAALLAAAQAAHTCVRRAKPFWR